MNLIKFTQLIELVNFMNSITKKECSLLNDRLQDFWIIANQNHFRSDNEDIKEYFDKCYVQIQQSLKLQKWDYFIEKEMLKSLAWEDPEEALGPKPNYNLEYLLMLDSKYNIITATQFMDTFDAFVHSIFSEEIGDYSIHYGPKVTYINRVIAKCYLKWLLLSDNEQQQEILLTYTKKKLKILKNKQAIEQDFKISSN